MNHQIKFVTLLGFMLIAISCSHPGAELQETVFEDKDYSKSLELSTRDAKVFDNFQNRFEVSATLLDKSFTKSLEQRVQKIYFTDTTGLISNDANTAFFVSLFTPQDTLANLADSSLWSVFIEDSGERKFPVKIEKIKNKEKWKSFFPAINMWSSEYLILFDSKSSISDETLQKKSVVKLTLSNPDAKINLNWP